MVALVTGAGRGIGRAVAITLSQRCEVALLDADVPRVAETAAAIGGLPVGADIANANEVDLAVAQVERTLGPIDVLVNNVGIVSPEGSRAESVDAGVFRRVIDVNVIGTFLVAQRVGRGMIGRGNGVIVNVASIYAERAMDWRLYGAGADPPRQDDAAYHVSKAAVVQLTRVLATSWAPFGVRVVSVSPGPVDTEFVRETIDDTSLDKIGARVPMGRLATVDDIARVIGFVTSNDAAYVTGANIVVDGGWTCW